LFVLKILSLEGIISIDVAKAKAIIGANASR
jgi:hypothetical protein